MGRSFLLHLVWTAFQNSRVFQWTGHANLGDKIMGIRPSGRDRIYLLFAKPTLDIEINIRSICRTAFSLSLVDFESRSN
jgi:hypothetical protein